mgnify:CR=1 FL=1|jgi:excisionase family DNA binding protein
MEKYLTSEQVAQILQIHPFTVLKYLKNGTLGGVKMGRVYRIKESDVEKFLQSMAIGKPEQKPEPEPKPTPKLTPEPTPKEVTHEIKFSDDENEASKNEYYQIL